VTIPAADLVPGDLVKLSLGAVVASDVHLISGSVLLDQSMLTGESIPIEAGAGFDAWAGAVVRRGEAVALVTATGERTKFGRSADLIRTAKVESSQQRIVLRVVRNPVLFNGGVSLLLRGQGARTHLEFTAGQVANNLFLSRSDNHQRPGRGRHPDASPANRHHRGPVRRGGRLCIRPGCREAAALQEACCGLMATSGSPLDIMPLF